MHSNFVFYIIISLLVILRMSKSCERVYKSITIEESQQIVSNSSARMKRNFIIFAVLLAAEIVNCNQETNSTLILPSQIMMMNATESDNDIAVRNALMDLATGKWQKDDTNIVQLIKNGISEAAMQSPENSKAFLRAGAKKAQSLVSDVTAAYTYAIFRAKSADEAQEKLARFQDTIQMIVSFTKAGKFVPN